jgi:hypothetical protein
VKWVDSANFSDSSESWHLARHTGFAIRLTHHIDVRMNVTDPARGSRAGHRSNSVLLTSFSASNHEQLMCASSTTDAR